MAKSSASTRIKPIEVFVLAGVCRRVEEGLDLAKGSVMIRTREEAYDVFVQKREKAPTFPFAYLTYGTVGDSNRHRPNVTARGIVNRFAINEGDREYAISIIPVTMGMVLEFATDDYLKALKFISDAKFMQHFSLLDFTLEYRGIPFTIESQVGGELTLPPKSKAGQDVSAFVFNVDITVHGYVSSDGGKYDTKLKNSSKIIFVAQLDEGENGKGEVLFRKEIDLTPTP
ncbi:hypothetical protein Voja6_00160 [Pseudomonas phage vB_PpuM-Voja-6]